MQRRLKLIAWLLLATVSVLPIAAQVSPIETAPQSAGCDEHGGTMPSRPASYACCQGGHDAAVPQEAFSLRGLLGQVSSILDFAATLVGLTEPSLASLPPASDSPPLAISLRI
jgi:hypothetical protein